KHALIGTGQSPRSVDGGFDDSGQVQRWPESISGSCEGRIDSRCPRARIDADDEQTHLPRTSLIVGEGKDVLTTAAAMPGPFELAAIGSAPLQRGRRAPGAPVGGEGSHRFSLTIEHPAVSHSGPMHMRPGPG